MKYTYPVQPHISSPHTRQIKLQSVSSFGRFDGPDLHICSCLIMWRSQPRRNSSHTSTHPLHRCHTLLVRIQWNTTSAKFNLNSKKETM